MAYINLNVLCNIWLQTKVIDSYYSNYKYQKSNLDHHLFATFLVKMRQIQFPLEHGGAGELIALPRLPDCI